MNMIISINGLQEQAQSKSSIVNSDNFGECLKSWQEEDWEADIVIRLASITAWYLSSIEVVNFKYNSFISILVLELN